MAGQDARLGISRAQDDRSQLRHPFSHIAQRRRVPGMMAVLRRGRQRLPLIVNDLIKIRDLGSNGVRHNEAKLGVSGINVALPRRVAIDNLSADSHS